MLWRENPVQVHMPGGGRVDGHVAVFCYRAAVVVDGDRAGGK
jgi:hypothetical protein